MVEHQPTHAPKAVLGQREPVFQADLRASSANARPHIIVMAGHVPAIHVLTLWE
jgi:hypothetical protein